MYTNLSMTWTEDTLMADASLRQVSIVGLGGYRALFEEPG